MSRSVSIGCQKPLWLVGGELALRAASVSSGSASQRVASPVDDVQRPGLDDEEAAVDPAGVAGDFLAEARTRSCFDVEDAEAAGGLHRGQRGQGLALAVEGDRRGDVHVADAVAVGEAEGPAGR